MTKAFMDKVIREGMVDTKAYRYNARVKYTADERILQIKRLPISSLDTTDAIDGWEVVKEIKEA